MWLFPCFNFQFTTSGSIHTCLLLKSSFVLEDPGDEVLSFTQISLCFTFAFGRGRPGYKISWNACQNNILQKLVSSSIRCLLFFRYHEIYLLVLLFDSKRCVSPGWWYLPYLSVRTGKVFLFWPLMAAKKLKPARRRTSHAMRHIRNLEDLMVYR